MLPRRGDFIVTLGSWRTTCVDAGPNGTLDTTEDPNDEVVGATITDGSNRLCDITAAPDDRQVGPACVGALAPGGQILSQQLLATYLTLAERRINAATAISSRLASRVGLSTVRAAAVFGIDTLALPPASNRTRYSNATDVLDEINRNRSPVYD